MICTLIKGLHTDRGREYITLEKRIRKDEIVHSNTAAHTPESNGLAKWYNDTLLEKMGALFHESKADHRFWREDALHAAYLNNVICHTSLEGCTLFEKFSGGFPGSSKIVAYGCKAHIREPKEATEQKLASRPKSAISVAIGNDLYRIWDVVVQILFASKHVSTYGKISPTTSEVNSAEAFLDVDNTTDLTHNLSSNNQTIF